MVLKGEKLLFLNGRPFFMQVGHLIFIPAGSYVFSQIFWNTSKFSSANFCLQSQYLNRKDHASQASPLLIKKGKPGCSQLPLLFDFLDHVLYSAHSILDFDSVEPVLKEVNSRFAFPKEVTGDELLFRERINSSIAVLKTIPEFAEQANMSLATFKRHFKALFGAAPKHWITQKKLEIAHFSLQTENLKIQDLTYQLGFENVSHFIQLFKRKYGFTPKGKLSQTQHF